MRGFGSSGQAFCRFFYNDRELNDDPILFSIYNYPQGVLESAMDVLYLEVWVRRHQDFEIRHQTLTLKHCCHDRMTIHSLHQALSRKLLVPMCAMTFSCNVKTLDENVHLFEIGRQKLTLDIMYYFVCPIRLESLWNGIIFPEDGTGLDLVSLLHPQLFGHFACSSKAVLWVKQSFCRLC
jgi:hypothetical protein